MAATTIDDIERFFIRQYVKLDATGDRDKRDPLWDHLRFIGNHKKRMRYVTLRNAGLPVGSGVTESIAKTVIGQRARGSGQRWREHGLRAAVFGSGYFGFGEIGPPACQINFDRSERFGSNFLVGSVGRELFEREWPKPGRKAELR